MVKTKRLSRPEFFLKRGLVFIVWLMRVRSLDSIAQRLSGAIRSHLISSIRNLAMQNSLSVHLSRDPAVGASGLGL
jgi:hypothetical protein